MTLEKIINIIRGMLAFLIPQLKNPNSIVGVKETIEAMIAANAITLFLISRFKDGVDFDDAYAIIKKLATDDDPAFRQVIKDGYENYALIPAEFKDIDAGEGLELVDVQLNEIPKFVEMFKKEEEVVVETK